MKHKYFHFTRCLLPLAAFAAVSLSGAAAAETCTGFKWSVDTEMGWATAPDVEAVASGGKIALVPVKAIELTLMPSPSVSLPVASDIKKQAVSKDSFSGWFTIDGVTKAGLYQISISNHAWIDVAQKDALVPSTAFSGDKDCKVLRKSVQYELGAGPATIQISGAPETPMKLTIREVKLK